MSEQSNVGGEAAAWTSTRWGKAHKPRTHTPFAACGVSIAGKVSVALADVPKTDLCGSCWPAPRPPRPSKPTLAAAWAEGYLRGTLDTASDLEPADNPYTTPAASGAGA